MGGSEANEHRTATLSAARRGHVLFVIVIALALAVGAVLQPFVDRKLNFETGAGPAYRMTEDGTIEFWRITWDRIYLEGITIGMAAAAAVALVGRQRPRGLNRRQTVILSVAICALLLTCLFPCVSYTDRSDIGGPGRGGAYQTPDGIWMSSDPILPRFLRGHRFVASEYTAVLWGRMGLEWGAIITVTCLLLVLIGSRTSTARSAERRLKHELGFR